MHPITLIPFIIMVSLFIGIFVYFYRQKEESFFIFFALSWLGQMAALLLFAALIRSGEPIPLFASLGLHLLGWTASWLHYTGFYGFFKRPIPNWYLGLVAILPGVWLIAWAGGWGLPLPPWVTWGIYLGQHLFGASLVWQSRRTPLLPYMLLTLNTAAGALVKMLFPMAQQSEVFQNAAVQGTGLIMAVGTVAIVLIYLDNLHQTLAERQKEYRFIVENLREGLYLYEPDGEIIYANQRLADILRCDVTDLLHNGQRMASFFYPEDLPQMHARLEARQQGVAEQYDLRIRRGDGTPAWVHVSSAPIADSTGNMVRTVTMIVDISARQEAFEALRLSEEKFAKVFHASPDGFIISRQQDRQYLDVNDGLLDLVGYTREEVIGQTAVTLNIFPFLATYQELYRRLAADGFVHDLEVAVRQKNGELITVLLSVETIVLNGEACFLTIVKDITERAQYEERLRQAQKLEGLGILAGGLAHDFNNLLVSMLTQTELAGRKLPEDHVAQLHLERARRSTERAADLTRQMLAFAGQQGLEEVWFDLNQAIRETVRLVEGSLPVGVMTTAVLTPHPLMIRADWSQTQQVFMNLILNAAEAMPTQTGEINLHTSLTAVPADNPYILSDTGLPLPSGHYVQVVVTDNGQGMPPEVQKRIFDPFFTTKFTGRGLGLAAVLGIVRRHRGGMFVESVVGEGTTFTLFWPYVPEEVVEDTAVPVPACLLLVDKNEADQQQLAAIGQALGVMVVAVKYETQGLEYLVDHVTAVTHLILANQENRWNLDETIYAYRQIRPNLRIYLTAPPKVEVKQVAGYLPKPYETTAVQAILPAHQPLFEYNQQRS